MRGTEKPWTTLAQFTRRPAIVYVCHSSAIVCLLCRKPEYMFEHDSGSFLELLFFSCEGSRLNPTSMLFTYYAYILTEILLNMADKADSQCQYQSEKPQKGEAATRLCGSVSQCCIWNSIVFFQKHPHNSVALAQKSSHKQKKYALLLHFSHVENTLHTRNSHSVLSCIIQICLSGSENWYLAGSHTDFLEDFLDIYIYLCNSLQAVLRRYQSKFMMDTQRRHICKSKHMTERRNVPTQRAICATFLTSR